MGQAHCKIRDDIAARKAAAEVEDADYRADLAEAYTQAAINFASAAIDEAEYFVLDAILAGKDATKSLRGVSRGPGAT